MTFLRSASSLSVKTRHYYSQVKYSKKINHFWKKSFLHKFKNKLAQFDTKVKYRSNCNESALSKRVADSIYQMQVSRAEIGWLHDNTAYSRALPDITVRSGSPAKFQSPDSPKTGRSPSWTPDFYYLKKWGKIQKKKSKKKIFFSKFFFKNFFFIKNGLRNLKKSFRMLKKS